MMMSKLSNRDKEDKSNVLQLTTQIYTEFYRDNVESASTDMEQKSLKTLYDTANCLNFGDLLDGSNQKYSRIGIVNYAAFRRVKEDSESMKQELIYRVDKIGDRYRLVAGKYCGYIGLPYKYKRKFLQIKIDCGYSERFFKRILDFCCGIYVNDSPIGGKKAEQSIYSLLVQYMFLVSLRKAVNNGLPKKYAIKRERGYDVKGNVDIESYVNLDLSAFDKKITSARSERVEIQSIVDVLYFALCCCDMENSVLPNLRKYRHYLHGLYSGVKPSANTIRKALSEPVLKSNLYVSFRQPLFYAEIIIKHNNLGMKNDSIQSSGFLVDASFLWETYLYNLLRLHFPDWNIDAQTKISVYHDMFYAKNNYPDIVMTNKATGKIVVLDAKFKKMKFKNDDVDMEDLKQIHFYSYYYSVKYPGKLVGLALVYPECEKIDSENRTYTGLFGDLKEKVKFGVFTIRDCGNDENKKMTDNERSFVNNLKKAFMEDL